MFVDDKQFVIVAVRNLQNLPLLVKEIVFPDLSAITSEQLALKEYAAMVKSVFTTDIHLWTTDYVPVFRCGIEHGDGRKCRAAGKLPVPLFIERIDKCLILEIQ